MKKGRTEISNEWVLSSMDKDLSGKTHEFEKPAKHSRFKFTYWCLFFGLVILIALIIVLSN